MKLLSAFILGVLLCSCTKQLFYSEWRAFEFNDLNARVSILRTCPVVDCYVVVRDRSGILFEDSKRRHPWFAVGLSSKDAYGVIVCDQTSDELFLLWNRVTNAKLSQTEVDNVIKTTLDRMSMKTTTSMSANQLICDSASVESEELRNQMNRIANSSGIVSLLYPIV